METVTYSITSLLMTCIIVGGVLYGCQAEGERYQQRAMACMQAGGSWVVTQAHSYDAVCISSSERKE